MIGPEHRWRARLDARADRRRRKPKKMLRDIFGEYARQQLTPEQMQAQYMAKAMQPAKSGSMPTNLLHGVLGRLF